MVPTVPQMHGTVTRVSLTTGSLFCVHVWSTISLRSSPLSANKSQTLTFDTSTSSICCNTCCSTSEFAILGSLQYAGCLVSSVFSSSFSVTASLLSLFPLPASCTISCLSYALVVTNSSISPIFSNSTITPHTNSSSSSYTASTNELNLAGAGAVLDRCGGRSQIFSLTSIAPLSPPG